MLFYVLFACVHASLAFYSLGPKIEVDQEAMIQCNEIHPPPRSVAFSYYSNGGCNLTCILSNGVWTEDHVTYASNGTDCGLNGFCDGYGICKEQRLPDYTDPEQARMLCRRQNKTQGSLTSNLEYDGGCEIQCVRDQANYTIRRHDGWRCGPDMICIDGACVIDEDVLDKKIAYLLDGINGTQLCQEKNQFYKMGDLRNHGCLLECYAAVGVSSYHLNNGGKCHLASKCIHGVCENVTEITKTNFASVKASQFKQQLKELFIDEYMGLGLFEKGVDKYAEWRQRALDRSTPLFRRRLDQIERSLRSGESVGFLRSTPLRARVNYLASMQHRLNTRVAGGVEAFRQAVRTHFTHGRNTLLSTINKVVPGHFNPRVMRPKTLAGRAIASTVRRRLALRLAVRSFFRV